MAFTTTEQNEQTVRRTVEEFNEQNYDVFDEVFAVDIIDHVPAGETRGREGPREGLKMLFTAFPDLVITIDDLVAEGDTVALRTTHRGTQEGEFTGIEPTGKQIEVDNAVFAQCEDGKVAEGWVLTDTLEFMQQLGAIEGPG